MTGFVSDYKQPFLGAISITPGTNQVPRRAIYISCTVAGNVNMLLADGTSIVLPVAVGVTSFPFAVKTVVVSGTTATATYFNLV